MKQNDEEKTGLIEGEHKNDNQEKKDSNNVVVEKKEEKKPEENNSDQPSVLNQVKSNIMESINAVLFELVGTFLFMTALLLGASHEASIIAFWIIIVMVAPFSGGHLNPAVTLACYVYDMQLFKGLGKLIMYVLFQILGGYLGLIFSQLIRDNTEIKVTRYQSADNKEFISEAFFTGTFVFVILYVCSKTTRVSDNRALNCGLIASWLYYASSSASTRSIGALNPIVIFVVALYNDGVYFSWYQNNKNEVWQNIWAELAGAFVFAILFFLVEKAFPSQESSEVKKEEQIEVKS